MNPSTTASSHPGNRSSISSGSRGGLTKMSEVFNPTTGSSVSRGVIPSNRTSSESTNVRESSILAKLQRSSANASRPIARSLISAGTNVYPSTPPTVNRSSLSPGTGQSTGSYEFNPITSISSHSSTSTPTGASTSTITPPISQRNSSSILRSGYTTATRPTTTKTSSSNSNLSFASPVSSRSSRAIPAAPLTESSAKLTTARGSDSRISTEGSPSPTVTPSPTTFLNRNSTLRKTSHLPTQGPVLVEQTQKPSEIPRGQAQSSLTDGRSAVVRSAAGTSHIEVKESITALEKQTAEKVVLSKHVSLFASTTPSTTGRECTEPSPKPDTSMLKRSSIGRFARIDTPEIEAATTSRPPPPVLFSQSSSASLSIPVPFLSSSSKAEKTSEEPTSKPELFLIPAKQTESPSDTSKKQLPLTAGLPSINEQLQDSKSMDLLNDIGESPVPVLAVPVLETPASSPATPDVHPDHIIESPSNSSSAFSDETTSGTTPNPIGPPPDLVEASPEGESSSASVPSVVSTPRVLSQSSSTRIDDSIRPQPFLTRFTTSRSSKLARGPTIRVRGKGDSDLIAPVTSTTSKNDDRVSHNLTGGILKRPITKYLQDHQHQSNKNRLPVNKPQPQIVMATSPLGVTDATWFNELTEAQPNNGLLTASQIAEMVSGITTIPTPSTASIDSSAFVCATSVLTGSHSIVIGKNTIIQPGALINAENGPIEIGDGNIIEELVIIQNRNPAPLKIGNFNLFETASKVLGGSKIGNCNQLEPKSIIGSNVMVANGCIISSGSSLNSKEDKKIPSGSIVYGLNGALVSGIGKEDEATKLMKHQSFISMLATKLLPILSSTQSRRQGHGLPDVPPTTEDHKAQ